MPALENRAPAGHLGGAPVVCAARENKEILALISKKPQDKKKAPAAKKPAGAPKSAKAKAVKAKPAKTKAVVARIRRKILPPLEPQDDRLADAVKAGLEDAKAENIIAIDLRGKTTLADVMFVASGRSSVHVGAIADRVARACKSAGFPPPRIEGLPHCDWVLLDARDAIVHIFKPDVRQFYNLEKMWGDDRPDEARRTRSA